MNRHGMANVGDDARRHGDQDVLAVRAAHPAVTPGRRSQVIVAVIIDVYAPFDVHNAATIIVPVPMVLMAVVIIIVMVIVIVIVMVTVVVLVLGGGRHWQKKNEAEQYGGQQAFHGSPKVFGWRCDPMMLPTFVPVAMKKH